LVKKESEYLTQNSFAAYTYKLWCDINDDYGKPLVILTVKNVENRLAFGKLAGSNMVSWHLIDLQ